MMRDEKSRSRGETCYIKAGSWEECATAALEASAENPGKYITVSVIFSDARLRISPRLDSQAAGDHGGPLTHKSCRGYWLNGRFKPFSTAQHVENQRHGYIG